MTVGELKEILSGCDNNLPVRLMGEVGVGNIAEVECDVDEVIISGN